MTQFVVTVDRLIAAPREKVYRAWLDPAVLARWMGPDGSSVVDATVDERVGGAHHVELIGPDGSYYSFVSVIEELVPDERIVLTFTFDGDGEDTLLTLTFRDAEGGGTELHLQHERIMLRPPLDEPVGRHRLDPDPDQVAGVLRRGGSTMTTTPAPTPDDRHPRRVGRGPPRPVAPGEGADAPRRRVGPGAPRPALGARRRGVRVRHRARPADAGRAVRRPLAADRVPLHVRPGLGRGLPELLVDRRPHRPAPCPPRAPRRHVDRGLPGPAAQAARLPGADGVVVPVGVVVRQRLQRRLPGLLDRRAPAAGVQLHPGVGGGPGRTAPASCPA